MRLLLVAMALMLAACTRQSAPALQVASQKPAMAKPQSVQTPLDMLVAAIGEHRFVLIGEVHGTRETPTLVGDLVAYYVDGGGPVTLGLEVSAREQPRIDRYLESPGNAGDRKALLAGEHWQGAMHDGRDSEAMLELIDRVRELRLQGADVRIDLFDASGDGDRDLRMSGHLRATAADAQRARILVLTGNVHAMTRRPPWSMFTSNGKLIEPPMTVGRYLADLAPQSINIGAANGDAWNCAQDGCRAHSLTARPAIAQATLKQLPPTESAWDAELTLPRFTASPPAIQGADH
ncbi:calcium-binding protein [Pseudoluteimonas lycopersici]|uniref:Calcium-binding protein n=2 Tax=Pseudoluteimonas lycopersici TaxID=1324796 RepID=A0A516V5V4_9GAMM|nr:calcium-binding protein [Lysobacter lycopersici]